HLPRARDRRGDRDAARPGPGGPAPRTVGPAREAGDRAHRGHAAQRRTRRRRPDPRRDGSAHLRRSAEPDDRHHRRRARRTWSARALRAPPGPGRPQAPTVTAQDEPTPTSTELPVRAWLLAGLRAW